MHTSPFPGMDPYLEQNPQWEVFHGWFIRELARLSVSAARELGCTIDVERSVYGRDSTGELVLFGEPDALLLRDHSATQGSSVGAALEVARPQAIHEVTLQSELSGRHKQEYIVVRTEEAWTPVLAVVELLSFANKQGTYATKYREKRSHYLASSTNFMEIDFLRAGTNPSRELFRELPTTAYFIYIARKNGYVRLDEGYPLGLREPLPKIGLPLGPGRIDLPLDLAGAFRSAYDLGYRSNWLRYGREPVPPPTLAEDDRSWVNSVIQAGNA